MFEAFLSDATSTMRWASSAGSVSRLVGTGLARVCSLRGSLWAVEVLLADQLLHDSGDKVADGAAARHPVPNLG